MENTFLLLLHKLLPLVYGIVAADIIFKMALISRYKGISLEGFVTSFFIVYNRSNLNMFGSCRRKRFMIANNRSNFILYAAIVLLLFMRFVIRDQAAFLNLF